MRARPKPRKPVKVVAPTKAKALRRKTSAPTPKATAKSMTKAPASSVRTEALRKILMERRHAVLKEIEGLIGHQMSDEMQGRSDAAPDVGDQALLDAERGRDISILEMRNRVRQQIDEALARLDEGAFGLCVDCGVEISEKRLKAVPFARRCVSCQEKEEQLEKIEQEEEQES